MYIKYSVKQLIKIYIQNTPIPNSLIMQKLEWHISVAKKHQIQTRWVLCWYSKFRIYWKRRSVFFNMEKFMRMRSLLMLITSVWVEIQLNL